MQRSCYSKNDFRLYDVAGDLRFTPMPFGLQVSGVARFFRGLSKKGFQFFWLAGVQCPSLPKTPKDWIQNELNDHLLYFHADFDPSGLLKTPKNWISDFSLIQSLVFWSSEDRSISSFGVLTLGLLQ